MNFVTVQLFPDAGTGSLQLQLLSQGLLLLKNEVSIGHILDVESR